MLVFSSNEDILVALDSALCLIGFLLSIKFLPRYAPKMSVLEVLITSILALALIKLNCVEYTVNSIKIKVTSRSQFLYFQNHFLINFQLFKNYFAKININSLTAILSIF